MEKMKKLVDVYSSADPAKLSASLKGIIGFVVMLASMNGVQGLEPVLNELVESILALITQIGAIMTGLYAVYGVIRRINNIFLKT